MAEVLGIAAGAAGFVSLIIQVISGIDTLRDISNRANEAPAELDSLVAELECLKYLMEKIRDEAGRNDNSMLQLCHESCKNVATGLEKLQKKVPTKSEGRGKQKVLKIFTYRHWKEDVEALQQSIQGAKINLLLVNTCRTRVQLEEIKILNQIHSSPPEPLSPEVNIHATPPLLLIADAYPSDKSKVESNATACIQPIKLRRKWNCAERACSCSCHHTVRIGQRFWSLEYTPLYAFRQTCDNKFCSATKYGGTFRIALSQLGIRWSAVIQFHVLAAPGKFLFRPAFDVERIVPYTSPGFQIIWRCQRRLITHEEAHDSLINLYQSDPTFKDHVDPDGISYIEKIVMRPWGGPGCTSAQFELLNLFMRELGMTRGLNHPRFLVRCAKWIGEGPHLSLLETLLDLGFDPTVIDSPNVQDWPMPSSPDWIAEEYTPDPFFIECQIMLLRDNQGFAGMTPLHEAVLIGSLESVKELIPRSNKNERNFLGQTPVHFSVSNPRYLRALVNAGHDVDAADNYGITPLMYAAAANHEESLITLLGLGADPSLQDTRFQRTFMQYAAIREHWNLIFNSLCWIEAAAGKDTAEDWAKHATILYHVVYPNRFEATEVSFQKLLAKCGSVNFTFDTLNKHNSSLLHHVRSINDVEVLLEHGFTFINHVNSDGQHALISAAINPNEPGVLQRLIDAGATIDLSDNSCHRTLYYVLQKPQIGHEDTIWAAVNNLRVLLFNGADFLYRDGCRCPCSPNGCLPSAVLSHSVHQTCWRTGVPLWSFEWLSLVLEHRGIREGKMVLLSFIRKAKFDEMGMTHVCCGHDGQEFSRLFQKPSISDEDIDEILDEESEFIEILENEMAPSCAKVYETLLDDWIFQIKGSVEKLCEKAMEYNSNTELNKNLIQAVHLVDYKNDRFRWNVTSSFEAKNPSRDVTHGFAEYIVWMEHEYQYGSASSLVDQSPRDGWYFKRISWLRRLISALELSITDIADSMRNMWTPNREEIYGPMNVEGGIKHFLRSWETGEEG